jgi:hypothetical protein
VVSGAGGAVPAGQGGAGGTAPGAVEWWRQFSGQNADMILGPQDSVILAAKAWNSGGIADTTAGPGDPRYLWAGRYSPSGDRLWLEAINSGSGGQLAASGEGIVYLLGSYAGHLERPGKPSVGGNGPWACAFLTAISLVDGHQLWTRSFEAKDRDAFPRAIAARQDGSVAVGLGLETEQVVVLDHEGNETRRHDVPSDLGISAGQSVRVERLAFEDKGRLVVALERQNRGFDLVSYPLTGDAPPWHRFFPLQGVEKLVTDTPVSVQLSTLRASGGWLYLSGSFPASLQLGPVPLVASEKDPIRVGFAARLSALDGGFSWAMTLGEGRASRVAGASLLHATSGLVLTSWWEADQQAWGSPISGKTPMMVRLDRETGEVSGVAPVPLYKQPGTAEGVSPVLFDSQRRATTMASFGASQDFSFGLLSAAPSTSGLVLVHF